MSFDPKFVEFTADVLQNIFIKYPVARVPSVSFVLHFMGARFNDW